MVKSIQDFWDWLCLKAPKAYAPRIIVILSPFTYLILKRTLEVIFLKRLEFNFNNPFERVALVCSIALFVGNVVYYKFIRNSGFRYSSIFDSISPKTEASKNKSGLSPEEYREVSVEITSTYVVSFTIVVLYLVYEFSNILIMLAPTSQSEVPVKKEIKSCRDSDFETMNPSPIVVKAYTRAVYGECAKRGIIKKDSFCQEKDNTVWLTMSVKGFEHCRPVCIVGPKDWMYMDLRCPDTSK